MTSDTRSYPAAVVRTVGDVLKALSGYSPDTEILTADSDPLLLVGCFGEPESDDGPGLRPWLEVHPDDPAAVHFDRVSTPAALRAAHISPPPPAQGRLPLPAAIVQMEESDRDPDLGIVAFRCPKCGCESPWYEIADMGHSRPVCLTCTPAAA